MRSVGASTWGGSFFHRPRLRAGPCASGAPTRTFTPSISRGQPALAFRNAVRRGVFPRGRRRKDLLRQPRWKLLRPGMTSGDRPTRASSVFCVGHFCVGRRPSDGPRRFWAYRSVRSFSRRLLAGVVTRLRGQDASAPGTARWATPSGLSRAGPAGVPTGIGY